MNIGLNGLFLSKKITGGGRYLLNLVNELGMHKTNENYFIFLNRKSFKKNIINNLFIENINCGFCTSFRPLRLFWESLLLPDVIKKNKIDLFHASGFTLPARLPCRSIVTIFDMTFFLMPEVHQKVKTAYFRNRIPLTLKKADMIIAISNQTKNDIVNILPEHKIRVIYLGLDKKFKPLGDSIKIQTTRMKYNLPQKYILFVGTVEPRKNISRIILAFDKIKKKGSEHKLLIAGEWGWNYKEILLTINRLGLKDEIIFTHYVTDEDMPFIYNGASVFVYPSLYEGFGIPVLEAMACGVPVVTSCVSSLPEVAGEAAILIDPRNIEEISNAIDKVLRNSGLAEQLKIRGMQRAAKFSNQKMALETMDVYRKVLSG